MALVWEKQSYLLACLLAYILHVFALHVFLGWVDVFSFRRKATFPKGSGTYGMKGNRMDIYSMDEDGKAFVFLLAV